MFMIDDLEDKEKGKACSTPAPGGDPLTPAEGGWATCFFRVFSLPEAGHEACLSAKAVLAGPAGRDGRSVSRP